MPYPKRCRAAMKDVKWSCLYRTAEGSRGQLSVNVHHEVYAHK